MKILICPDKFKESLPAEKVAEHIKTGIRRILKDAECITMPVADGGEGTVAAIVAATKGKTVRIKVHDPLMRQVDSFYGITGDHKTGVIEMAAASGLALLKPDERDPMITTTYGTGELIRKAIDQGCTRIIIGIGGSATVDGGVGMASALGIRFTDASGNEIPKGGGNLDIISKIDTSNIDNRVNKCKIIAASDVTNVLTGKEGAAYVFGPQKGANEQQVRVLDENLKHLSKLIMEQLHIDVRNISGGGAAGGLGAGILAFLGGEIRKGFDVVCETVRLEDYIKIADLVITGEGRIDNQTAYGKTPFGVAQIAAKYGKPVIAFTGNPGEGHENLYKYGISAIIPITDKPMSPDESIRNAGILLEQASERMARVLKLGSTLFG